MAGRDHVMLLDFDRTVVGIASQPFWLSWTAADGRSRSHAPDYFARRTDGSAVVMDCRPADRRDRPRDVAAFEATRQTCAEIGREYRLGHKHIGTGHLLLGLVRERKGVVAQTLVDLGVDLPTVRQQVIQQLSAYAGGEEDINAAEREEELIDEGLELPEDEVMELAAFMLSDQIVGIRALLRDVVERLERIERHLTDGDDTP